MYMTKLKGIAASDGIVIAKVFKLEELEIQFEEKTHSPSKELSRLTPIIDETKNQLIKVKESASKNLSKEEAQVFDAHLQLVDDPLIISEIEQLIKNDFLTIEAAISKSFKKFEDMFAAMDDAYMKERAADVSDVSKRMLMVATNTTTHDLSTIDSEVIIVADDVTPSQTAQMNKSFVKGFAANIGGRTSHAAIMARSLEIPAILGLKNITELVKNDDIVILDGNLGEVIINPSNDLINKYNKKIQELIDEKIELKKFIGKKTKTIDGKEIELVCNIGGLNDVEGVLRNDGEGVGLFRSEFLYMDSSNWPNENKQYEVYKNVVSSFKPDQRVIVRTLDIGGDKNLSYYKFEEEMNPFLGHRAIRLCLEKKDILKTQLRALIRASAHGKIAIMFPMIATIEEFLEAKEVFNESYKELKSENVKVAKNIEVGMMVEVPIAAIMAAEFAKHVDFFSIGTNDLMQYSMAADRMNPKVSYLYQPLNPGILRLIKSTIDGGHKHNKFVGMCGELAGNLDVIPILLGLGLDEFSMSATSILKARKLISNYKLSDAQALAKKVLDCSTEEEVKKILKI